MYLAGSFLMFLAVLTVIGMFLSDLLLAVLDPRIRLDGRLEPMTTSRRGDDRLPHYVSDAPFDVEAVEQLTPEQERYYLASQWRLMWWRFRRHKVALVAGIILAIGYGSILITEFLAPYALESRNTDFIYAPPQRIRICSTTAGSSAPSSTASTTGSNMETLKREYADNRGKVAADPLLLPRRPLRVLGADPRRPPPDLPGRGRHAVPARHRPAGPRHRLAHPLRRAHLAHRRADRHRHQLHPRHHHRRHRRLLRRLGRQRRAAGDRDPPLAPRAAAVDGAVGRAAGHLEPAPGLLRHHHHPRPARLARPRPRRALQAAGAARGGLLRRRAG